MWNVFSAVDSIQQAYKDYVKSLQHIKNPKMQEWIEDKIENGNLLWKYPYIQLNKRFERGDDFQTLINQGVLYKGTEKCFTIKAGDRTTPPVTLYKHQSEAIRSIMEKNANTIITTGTGSGKSFCFAIPIVSKCLEMKEKGISGIKAVIIYPMNALANSQYSDLACRLQDSGLTIALYTGDTEYTHEDALQQYRNVFDREKPYNSEVLSREEIHKNPPDILMTNYQMLELILTRFEDKKLFKDKGILQFLVLDEIHTYIGKRGADVACLIRRLKQHTDTIGKLRCIGTSATVKGGEGEDTNKLIAEFATKLFGDTFDPGNVIGEYLVPPYSMSDEVIANKVNVTEEMLNEYDGSIEKTASLIEALIGRTISSEEKTPLKFGELLKNQATFNYIEKELNETMAINELTEGYREKYRPNATFDDCLKEIKAALMAGMSAKYILNGQEETLLVPKIHIFFSQGHRITSCLMPQGPHLDERGEVYCSECKKEGSDGILSFPIVFCRACGQEFYGAALQADNTFLPRGMNDNDISGKPVYIYLLNNEDEENEELYNSFEIHNYCPICNKIDGNCGHNEFIRKIALISSPFKKCPSCGVEYDRGQEYNKLFSFGMVGRSTATDVIISNIIAGLPEEQRKLIAFTDNRQDTALQASHINFLSKKIFFRRSIYHALKEAGCIEGSSNYMNAMDLSSEIYEIQRRTNTLPNFQHSTTKYNTSARSSIYKDYLRYCIYQDTEQYSGTNFQDLEKSGLLIVTYENLNDLAADEDEWKNVAYMNKSSLNLRHDFVMGILDIMRKAGAINDEMIIDVDKAKDTILKLNEDILFHNSRMIITGFTDDNYRSIREPSIKIRRIIGKNNSTAFVKWAQQVFNISSSEAAELIKETVNTLLNTGFLVEVPLKIGKSKINTLMVNSDIIIYQISNGEKRKLCPKCGTYYSFKELNKCIKRSCGNLISKEIENNYFVMQYTEPLEKTVNISAAEHSGQIEGKDRKKLEEKFRSTDDALNLLVCTPTMELGIDIGELSAVYMRNVPPNSSNYAQRAGRAGRRGQPALIVTFCGFSSKYSPHDQYFYKRPQKIISGEIGIPRFSIDNKMLMITHIHSLILETINFKLESKPASIININDENFKIYPELINELKNSINVNFTDIVRAIKIAFAKEIVNYEWFNDDFIDNTIKNFTHDFDEVFDAWRSEYRNLSAELNEINRTLRYEKYDNKLSRKREYIEQKMSDMREGERGFYTYRYLGARGFLPGYAFPSATTTVFLSNDEIAHNREIAMSEYGPGNFIYYKNQRFVVWGARPKTKDNKVAYNEILICDNCGTAYIKEKANISVCEVCGTSLEGVMPMTYLEMPDMIAVKRYNITADEEERMRNGYDITYHYGKGNSKGTIKRYNLLNNGKKIAEITYEHNGHIITINNGIKNISLDSEEDDLAEPSSFAICETCNKWLLKQNKIEEHKSGVDGRCGTNGSLPNVKENVKIYTDSIHDIMIISLNLPDEFKEVNDEKFYTTFLAAFLSGLDVVYETDESELNGFLMHDQENNSYRVVIYEVAEGGEGILENLISSKGLRFQQVIKEAMNIMHEGQKDGCERACYDCLCSYRNQHKQHLLDRNLVLPLLREMKEIKIIETNKNFSLGNYQNLYDKCESELEKEVLSIINKEGLPLPSYSQYTINIDGHPLIRADFYYYLSGKRPIVVCVDGPQHDNKAQKDRDEKTRNLLKSRGYKVIEIKYNNINDGIEKLKHALSII